MHFKKILLILFISVVGNAQNLNINGAFTLDAKITLGNQNNLLQLGVSMFGISNYNKIAIEGGVSFYTGYMLQRHTIKKSGIINGYDVFYLAGYGNNNNLLGSTLSQYNNAIMYDNNDNNSFCGIGFGFEKQFLPEHLNEFEQRIGRFISRYSKNNQSYGFTFKNDLKIGNLFYGNATDYGNTGSLYFTYSNAKNINNIQQLGIGIVLFTPEQDYEQIANNKLNSDDGRKNVWHTTGNYPNTFYANSFVSYKLQKNQMVYDMNLGIESNKMGAFIQNKLHDNFGLNPRFPWKVKNKNGVYVQGEIQTFINSL